MNLTTPAKLEKAEFEREVFSAQKIPYAYLLDNETVETKSGNLLQVIKVDGLIAETMDDLEIDLEKNIRNSLLKSITDSSISIYFHTIRKKDNRTLGGSYKSAFASQLNDKWQNKIKNEQFFINEQYITVIKKPPVGKIRRFSDLFSALSGSVNKEARDTYRTKVHKDLMKVTGRTLSHLSHYGAKKLTSDVGANSSEVLSFLAELINLEKRKMILPRADLANYLPSKRLFFDKTSGTFAIRGIDNKSTFAAILSIKEYDKGSAAGMLDHLLDIKTEMIITQTFSFLDKGDAKKKIKEQQRNQQQSEDGSVTETAKIDETLDNLGNSTSSTGEHHFSVLCKEDSIEALEKSIAKIDAALNEVGIIGIREDVGIKAAFFAMLPANHAYITRRAIVSSQNVAGFASMHNYATGKFDGNYWGRAVTTLETISGTPYFFNFHVLDVANTFLIGPMGSGKTLLEAFLLAQSMKSGGRLIVFDKDRGLEIFVRAMDGLYSVMDAGHRTGFAPFQIDDTIDNRYFLSRLMRKIATYNGQPISDEDIARIKNAVDGAFQLPKEERILRNIVPFFGMRKTGSLRARFDNWVNDGDYAWVFDNETDDLSLQSDVIGFDMSSILSDSIVCEPIYFYLFHRIEQMMDGTKTRIVVAEGWRALQDEEFRKQIQEWSSTPRKKEAFLVIDTQSPEDIVKSPIACKIIQETVTQIYFANPKANHDDYVGKFGLSEKEYQIVKQLTKESRFFLLKQGKNSVVVRADFSGFEDEIAILSGRSRNIKLLGEIRQITGDKPQDWLPIFLDQVKNNGAEK